MAEPHTGGNRGGDLHRDYERHRADQAEAIRSPPQNERGRGKQDETKFQQEETLVRVRSRDRIDHQDTDRNEREIDCEDRPAVDVTSSEQHDDEVAPDNHQEDVHREERQRQFTRDTRDQIQNAAQFLAMLEPADGRQHYRTDRVAKQHRERKIEHADRVDGVRRGAECARDEVVGQVVLEPEHETR